jgi:hypothetical protein
MRRTVWTAFEVTLALIVIGIAVFIATLLMRFGLKLAEKFAVEYLPFMLRTMWADKWYILAFILAALLLWSWPVSDEQPEWQPSPVRRGRHVERFPRAAPRASLRRGGVRPASITVRKPSPSSKIRRTS